MITRATLKHQNNIYIKCKKCQTRYHNLGRCYSCQIVIKNRWKLQLIKNKKLKNQFQNAALYIHLFSKNREFFNHILDGFNENVKYSGNHTYLNPNRTNIKNNFYKYISSKVKYVNGVNERYKFFSNAAGFWWDYEAVEILAKRKTAPYRAAIIQNWWRNIYHNPYHPVGRRRIEREFNNYNQLLEM